MIGNLSTNCKAKQKRDLARLYNSQEINHHDDKPLSIQQLKDRKLENEQEITLDYEQWKKIMIQNDDGENNENKATKVYPRCTGKSHPNDEDPQKEKSKLVRKRTDQYANRGRIRMKFEYGDPEKPTGDKAKDMKVRGRVHLSNFGKDT
tara:strand:+ start:640 stop:1086 length:447 start_codon:yes stop_codon:yes gene_type:complete